MDRGPLNYDIIKDRICAENVPEVVWTGNIK